jgi:hypothetical protein
MIRASLAVLLALAVAAMGQPMPTTQPAGGGKVLRFEHLRVDMSAETVSFDASVCLREGLLELVACKWATKTHESIVHTKAPAWQLHAGLLALGLTPGKPAEWVYPPDQPEGHALPPRGPRVTILLRWTDPNTGQAREVPASSWLKTSSESKADIPSQWVFVGSDMIPGRGYAADATGDVISVANFATSVIDVPFESSNRDALLEYAADTDKIPPLGTPVEVVVKPVEGAADSPHARAVVEIGRDGRLRAALKPVELAGLADWAAKLLERHAKARVVVRAAAEARVHDVSRALVELRIGGIHDTRVERLEPDRPYLPRHAQQVRAELAGWQDRFARPEEYIVDPAESSAELLESIDAQRRDLRELEQLWAEYARRLSEARSQYTGEQSAEPTDSAEAP